MIPVISVTPVTEVVPVNPVVPVTAVVSVIPVIVVTEVVEVKPVVPVAIVKPDTIVTQAKPVIPAKPRISADTNTPDSETNLSGQVNPCYQRYTGTSGGIHGKWYRGIIEAGYGLGIGDYGINNFRLNFINGFKIGNSSLGLGIGYRRYFTDNNAAPYLVSKKSEVPVFLDFRTTFSDRKLTPYFALGLGGAASSDTTQSAKDRLFFTTSGGIWYNVSDRFSVFAGVAYELQKLEFSDTNPYSGNYSQNSNSISLNIGIAF